MACVYRVRHRTLDTVHALKVLTVPGGSVAERLVSEGRIQAKLRHPNVIAVTDVIEVGAAPALLMEFIDGPNLGEWLLHHRPLAIDVAERIFRGLLDGVERAHDAGVVHRDLKPGNVLMAGSVPRVTDFGIAKIVRDEFSSLGRTAAGATFGSPGYMSPEQVESTRDVDARSDVFALGCILGELVTGYPIFQRDSVMATLTAMAQNQWRPVEEMRPDVPPRIALAVRACLVRDRERRCPDCATLRKLLDGEIGEWDAPHGAAPATAVPAPGSNETMAPLDTVFPTPPRRRYAYGAVAAVVVGGWVLWMVPREAPEPPPVVAPPPEPAVAVVVPEPVAVLPEPVAPAPAE